MCRIVEEFEILKVSKQPDEVYDLSAGSFWFFQGEFLDSWQEVSKVPPNPWNEARDIQADYQESLYII